MKKSTRRPASKILGTLSRVKKGTVIGDSIHATIALNNGAALQQLVRDLQQQNIEHADSLKTTLGRSYGPIMRYKPRIKRLSNVVVEKLPTGDTILNIPQRMQEKGFNRFVHSKRFVNLQNGDTIFKEGDMKILHSVDFGSLKPGNRVWCRKYINGDYYFCEVLDEKLVRNTQSGEIFEPGHILAIETVTYSLIIKNENNMATKTAPAKKAAPKKAAAPVKKNAKPEEKGPGKIEQILALHQKGLSNQEIVAKGFNKTTVSIQVAKFKKGKAEKKAAKK